MNAPHTLAPLEAARHLAPQIRAAANEIEATRELPRPIFEALADAGLFLMGVPRALGGLELDLPQYVQVIEALARGDASTAWAVNQGSTFAMFAAFMDPKAACDIWTDRPRSVVSNSPAPSAQAIVVPGGFRVTGKQGFSTGCMHASWVAAHAQVMDNGAVRQRNGKPEIRYCILPKTQAKLHDTWKTRGMRGTGTHTFEVKDVFVPEDHTVLTSRDTLVTDGPRYRIPQTLTFAAGDGITALAVARSCLEAFFELAGAKAPRHMTGLLRDQSMTQLTVGQAEAALTSAHLYLMHTVNNIWDDACKNGKAGMDTRVGLRLSSTHAIRVAAQVVESVYSDCGGSAIFEGDLIQRHFQDIHVITQHVQGRRAFYEMVGKYHLGLPVDEARL
jgi:alkylation response protein AidB-like acyl-CoA dehydrogenase